MPSSPVIVWFRNDLRLVDQPALTGAVESGAPVVPIYIWSPEEEGTWPPGAASKWWLHESLTRLETSLNQLGSRLIVRRGRVLEQLRKVIQSAGANTIHWNRRYEPAVIARDTQLKSALSANGIAVTTHNGSLLHEPWTIRNKSGRPFQVFTPFWKTCLAQPDPPKPLPAPVSLHPPKRWPASLSIGELELSPRIPWTAGMQAAWNPGEAGARANLERFVSDAFRDYDTHRDRPDLVGTSRLSPHLHFGEISPRQVWNRLADHSSRRKKSSLTIHWRNSRFLAELGWREFAHHLLFHFPQTTTTPLRAEFERFPWHEDPAFLEAWQQGRTGYPLVDAGMRELWATGWMHNRVRMAVGSFLVKDLLIDWRKGAAWFWDTLVDADLANNTLGWQWVAGCGADAAPFFRIFNPVSQGEKFDPDGHYVRRWLPELGRLPARWIHRPGDAPKEVLSAAGIELGRTYPEPLVSHAIARNVALEAYSRLKAHRS